MLDRVASRTRSAVRLAVVFAVAGPVTLALSAGAAAASADRAPLAQDSGSSGSSAFGVFGPVGVVAVAIGLGGLALGLLRHRRAAVERMQRQRAIAQEAAAHTAELPAVPPSPRPRPDRENVEHAQRAQAL